MGGFHGVGINAGLGKNTTPTAYGPDFLSKQVGVGAGAGQFEDEDVGVDFVDEQPVGGDVTFAVGGPVAGEGMVAVGGGQFLAVAELGDDGVELGQGESALEKALVVALEGGRVADGKAHSAKSRQSWSRSV